LKDELLGNLRAGRLVVDSKERRGESLRRDYYPPRSRCRAACSPVNGEGVVDAIASMQASRGAPTMRLRKTTAIDKQELAAAFATARQAQANATRVACGQPDV